MRPNWTRQNALSECKRQIELLESDLVGEFTVEHLIVAEPWQDRLECLQWAVENRATAKEMVFWHRAKNGLDLFDEDAANKEIK